MRQLRDHIPSIHSLQFQLLTLYLLFAVPVTCAGTIFDRVGAQRLQDQVASADLALANALALQTRASLQSALDDVNRFASLPYVQVLNRQTLEGTFRAAVSQQESKTVFFLWWQGSTFTYYMTVPYSAVLDDPSFTSMPFLQNALQGDQEQSTLVSNGWQVAGIRGAVTAIYRRWHTMEDGGHTGIVGMVLPISDLSTALSLVQKGQNGTLDSVIVDGSGQFIASSWIAPATLPQALLSNWFPTQTIASFSQPQGYWIEADQNNNPAYLYTFTVVPDTGWHIILRHTAKAVFALSNDYHLGLLLAIAFYLICGVTFWWMAYRRLVKPLELLKEFSDGLLARQADLHNSYSPHAEVDRLSTRRDEIGTLSVALKDMERDLRMRLRELMLLYEAGRRLATSLYPGEVFEMVVEQAGRLLDCAGAAIVQIPLTLGNEPAIQIAYEKWSERAIDWAWLTSKADIFRNSVAGQLFENRLRSAANHFEVESRLESPDAETQHVLILPLATIGEAQIILVIIGRTDERYTAQEISLVRSFANQATLAVKNAGLYNQSDERLQQKIADLTALHEIALAITGSLELERVLDQIARRATELTATGWCNIRLVDGSNENVYLAAHGEIPAELKNQTNLLLRSSIALHNSVTEFFRHNPERGYIALYSSEDAFKSMMLSSAATVMKETGANAFLGVPLRWQNDIIGSLNVYSMTQCQFGQDTIQLLTVLANQAASAIVNARLYQEVAGEKGRLEAITQSMEEGLLLENTDGQVVYANKVWCAALGYKGQSLAGWKASDVLRKLSNLTDRPAQLEAQEKEALTSMDSTSPAPIFEFRMGSQDMQIKLFKVLNLSGEPIGWGRLLQDITREKELDRVKSLLISTVSHELRTPLTIIKGNASALLQTDVVWDTDSQRTFLADILTESDRLSRLVSDLLDLSRLELGKSILNKQWCDVAELIREVVETQRHQTGQGILFAGAAALPMIEVDPKRVQVIVRNLLENAFKYASGTAISVRVRPYQPDAFEIEQALLVEVEDGGPGIPASDKERIFERFYRRDNGYTRSVGGVGLGLAICRALVESHGGKIWVEDVYQGKGSVFKFTLPCAPQWHVRAD